MDDFFQVGVNIFFKINGGDLNLKISTFVMSNHSDKKKSSQI